MMLIQFENGTVYRIPNVVCAGGTSLLYGLAQEYTALGRLFVDSIWYDKPVTLVDAENNRKAKARVWRCHITGPVFAAFLKEAKEKDADADYSAIWELRPGEWEYMETDEIEGMLAKAKEAETGEIMEYHLDHSYYRR